MTPILTMRWSERRTVVRSAFKMTSTLNSYRRAISPRPHRYREAVAGRSAVPNLILVRRLPRGHQHTASTFAI
jgi:hypothetical protein